MYILTINTGNVTEGNDNKDSNSDENSFSSDAEGKKRGGEKELLMALNFGDKQSFLFSVLLRGRLFLRIRFRRESNGDEDESTSNSRNFLRLRK